MEERHNGIVEVVGSIPIGSTIIDSRVISLEQTKWKVYGPVFFLVATLCSCSDSSIQEKAEEILADEKESSNSPIQKSVDGLHFTQAKKSSGMETSVGFSREGHLSHKGKFQNGSAEGLWTTYFEDGRPRWQGYKKDGENHGPFIMWYENGRKRLEGSYDKGKKHGKSIAWHPNGVKWQIKDYSFGNPTGIWKKWDEQGNLISEVSHVEQTEENASTIVID